MEFSGKRVLVTGGSLGIGKACTEAFAARGAQIAINYHKNIDAAQETLAGLPGEGHALFQADVSQPDQAQKLIDDVITKFGRLDIVVNNAGISQRHPIDAVDYKSSTSSLLSFFNVLQGFFHVLEAVFHLVEFFL